MISIKFLLTVSIHEGNENQGYDHQIEIAMILNKFSQLLLYENVWTPVGRFCILSLGFKGYLHLAPQNQTLSQRALSCTV